MVEILNRSAPPEVDALPERQRQADEVVVRDAERLTNTRTRIVVLGGGFGGVAATRELERLCGHRAGVEITLVSRDNFFVLTPLLLEACSGALELRHCAQPIRPALRTARFVEATVNDVDVDRRVVHAVAAEGAD